MQEAAGASMNQDILMEKIIRDYGAAIKSAVYLALGGLPCADDVILEVQFAVLLAFRKFGEDWRPPRSFVYAVIKNKVNDYLRDKYRNRNLIEEMERRETELARQRETIMGHVHFLSRAEFKVFRLLGLGLNNKEIAGMLYISPVTVRSHMKQIHRKCGIVDRLRLGIAAHQICYRENGGEPCHPTS
jgi:RNA polymerase sigma factor (sigma-70 family)